jgi:succinate dehydrogenase hydrophobic anchor subunit
MNWLKKFITNENWLLLMPPVILLAWVCWPIGAWHQWTWFWCTIILSVLVWEAVSAWFSPDKKTISNVMRDYRRTHPVRFWTAMTLYMIFSFFLVIHLATF